MVKIQPVIKWSGSKRKQSEEIISHLPKKIKTYYEPFVGSGAVMFQLLHSDIEFEKVVCSDINTDLINLWNMIKYSPHDLITGYETLWNGLNIDSDIIRKKKYFNIIRDRYNKDKSPIDFFLLAELVLTEKLDIIQKESLIIVFT